MFRWPIISCMGKKRQKALVVSLEQLFALAECFSLHYFNGITQYLI